MTTTIKAVAVLIAWIWLHEVPTLVELAGGLLVVGGVVIVTRGPRSPQRFADQHRDRELDETASSCAGSFGAGAPRGETAMQSEASKGRA